MNFVSSNKEKRKRSSSEDNRLNNVTAATKIMVKDERQTMVDEDSQVSQSTKFKSTDDYIENDLDYRIEQEAMLIQKDSKAILNQLQGVVEVFKATLKQHLKTRVRLVPYGSTVNGLFDSNCSDLDLAVIPHSRI